LIKPFIRELRDEITPFLNRNQFSLPGKGCPMAIVSILDNVSYLSSQKQKVLLVFWDFSNAFCTFDHDAAMQIFGSYPISAQKLKLIREFLKQSGSITKISDRNGHYMSSLKTSDCGTPQGQIGSDFFFVVVNDNMEPIKVSDETAERDKYVDDFTDRYSSPNPALAFSSLRANEELLSKQSASLGLKLNESKTTIIPFNFTQDELENRSCTPRKGYRYSKLALGFNFDVTRTRTHDKIDVLPEIDACITRLHQAMSIIISLRKVSKNVEYRIKCATKLVFSKLYNLGLIFAYCSTAQFEPICLAIRKAIKCAGLDQMTDSNDVYRVSVKLPPKDLAIKQIIQCGLKFLDPIKVQKVDRYVLRMKEHEDHMPFRKKFIEHFNKLSLKSRVYIIDNLDPCNRKKMERVKQRIKDEFLKKFNDNLIPSDHKISKIISKNKYCRSRIEARKQIATSKKYRIDHTTPTLQRFRTRSFTNMKQTVKCFGPSRDLCTSTPPLDKKRKISPTYTQSPLVPYKRTSVKEKPPDRFLQLKKRKLSLFSNDT
jgi:hypothetical protein